MGGRRGRISAVTACAALVLAACSDDPPAVQPLPTTTTERSSDPFATTPTSPTTTPPTAAPLGADPFAVPADAGAITPEYVETVLNELAELDGDALRSALAAGSITTEARALLEAVYAPIEVQTQIEILVEDAFAGFPGIVPEPGDRRYRVDELLVTTVECIGATGTIDFGAVAPEVTAPIPVNIELRRDEERRLDDLNPTVWQVGRTEVLSDSEPVVQLCG